jgi:preprotein translocase subunit SecG
MGASFGSGASGSLFGATGSANFMSRSTAVCAAIFFACTLALAYFSNERAQPSSGGSVLDQATITAPAASAPPTGAALVPGAASAAAPAAAATPSAPAATASGAGAVPTK